MRKWIAPAMLMTLASGCATVAPLAEFCRRIDPSVAAHAEALSASADDTAVLTGERLIAGIDAGCE